MSQKRIFVLYTGGTIGMSQSANGLQPDTKLINKALVPYIHNFQFDWHLCQPLIDSSAVQLTDWQQWLILLANKINAYDGILILHGTDTLAYSVNLLALALQGLNKPVVLTGAQWPFDDANSDAPFNLATAVAAFELTNLKEVVIAFHGQLFAAIGSTKISTEDAAGFDNPHFGVLAQWDAQQGWHQHQSLILKREEKDKQLKPLSLKTDIRILCHTLVPGSSATVIGQSLLSSQADAVILQSYGHGNAPSDPDLIAGVRHFVKQGGMVVNISQVTKGCAAAVYAQGSALRQAGVISGGKTNLETAVALLSLAISNNWTTKDLQQRMQALQLI